MDSPTDSQTSDQMDSQMSDQMDSPIDSQTGDQMDSPMSDQMEDQILESLDGKIDNQSLKILVWIPFIVAFLLYLPSIGSEFVWDDDIIIRNDALTATGSSLYEWISSPTMGLYTPFRNIIVGVFRSVFGDNPLPFSLLGILSHAATASLGFLIVFNIWKRKDIAIAGSLIFAVHPLSVDRISFISSGVFSIHAPLMLGAILLAEKDISNKWHKYAISLILALLATASYEQAIVLPVLVLLWHILININPLKTSLIRSLPYFMISLIYLVIRTFVLSSIARHGAGYFGDSFTGFLPLLLSLTVYAQALQFLPIRLLADYQGVFLMPGEITLSSSALSLTAIAATIFWYIRLILREKRKTSLLNTAFPVLAGILCWLPASNLIPTSTIFAERHLYLWTLFTWSTILFALTGSEKSENINISRRKTQIFSLLIVLILFSSQTLFRQLVWHNEYTLFETTVRDNPEAVSIWIGLAGAQINNKENKEALVSLQNAESRNYTPPLYFWNKASALVNLGKAEEAVTALKEGIESGGGAKFHRNLALCYAMVNNRETALEQAEMFQQKSPNSKEEYQNILKLIDYIISKSGVSEKSSNNQ